MTDTVTTVVYQAWAELKEPLVIVVFGEVLRRTVRAMHAGTLLALRAGFDRLERVLQEQTAELARCLNETTRRK